jgi:hypothetical protein
MATLYPETKRSVSLVAAYTADYREIRLRDLRLPWQERGERAVAVWGGGIEQAIRRARRWLDEHPERVPLDDDWEDEVRRRDALGRGADVRIGDRQMREEARRYRARTATDVASGATMPRGGQRSLLEEDGI